MSRSSRAHNVASIALLLLGIAPAAVAFYFVTEHWVPLPYWDEWATPGMAFESWCNGRLSWSDLFAQHNESRKFFPRLVYLAFVQLGGWDVRKEMTLVVVTMCAIGAMFYYHLRRTPGASRLSALTVWVAGMFLCFAGIQLENFISGVQWEPLIPGLGVLVVGAINLSTVPFPRKCLLNAAVALIATYTFANGMLLWLLALPLPTAGELPLRRKHWLWLSIYLLIGLATVGLYFVGYYRPGGHPEFFGDKARFLNLAQYLTLWIGSYFRSQHVSALAAGIVVGSLFLAVVVGAVRLILSRGEWRSFYVPLLMTVYACGTGLAIALGRIGFGIEQALETRYSTFNLFFYLALLALAFVLYCGWLKGSSPHLRTLFYHDCAILALIGFVCWVSSYAERLRQLEAIHSRNVRLLRALEWLDVVPDNPDLALIYPELEVLRSRAHLFRSCNILRLRFIGPGFAQRLRSTAPRQGDDSHGRLEICSFDEYGNLILSGWAWLPQRNRGADRILVVVRDASGGWKPVNVLKNGRKRRPLTAREGTAGTTFNETIDAANIPAGDVTIAAWAIDLKAKEAIALRGETFMRAYER